MTSKQITIKASTLHIDDLVWMGSTHGWKRINTITTDGLRVKFTFSGGWAYRSFDEKLTVIR